LAEAGYVKTISLTMSNFCSCPNLVCSTICEREDEIHIHLRNEHEVEMDIYFSAFWKLLKISLIHNNAQICFAQIRKRFELRLNASEQGML
jgi:hypothetical protein